MPADSQSGVAPAGNPVLSVRQDAYHKQHQQKEMLPQQKKERAASYHQNSFYALLKKELLTFQLSFEL